MLDAAAERVVAIEVKSTVQKDRWPRLARGGAEQLTPEWLDRAANIGMRDLGFDSTDAYAMVVQLHFVRQQWRACLGTSALTALPVITMEQLDELGWVLCGSLPILRSRRPSGHTAARNQIPPALKMAVTSRPN